MLRSFVTANVKLSEWFEGFLPKTMTRDGNSYFLEKVLPTVLERGATVWDVGGGSRPYISSEQKKMLNIRIVGTDISEEELLAAPDDIYDEIVVGDLCTYIGPAEADHVICQSVMEHLPDNHGAMRALFSIAKPGGRILIFAPSRLALFARLNMMMPEALKRKLLFSLFPHKAEGHDGFKAYYDKCTPAEFEALAEANELEIEERKLFWVSSYFKAFVPAYLAWRVYQAASRAVRGDQAAETFLYVLRRPENALLKKEAV